MAAQTRKPRKRKQAIDRGGAATPQGTYTAPALEKAFDIIEFLGHNSGGASLGEIAIGLNRSIGEIFRIIIVMERRGFLQKSVETDRYSVAYKILDLAYRVTPAQDLVRAATPVMQALAARISQSCHLVVPNGDSGLVIARVENPGIRGFALRLGAAVDMIRSCSGHVILAFSDDSQRQRLIDQAARMNLSRIELDKLKSELEEVRRRGFDRRPSPITHGVTDISVPVFGFHGNLMAALTVPFLELIDGSQAVGIAEAARSVAVAAQDISSALGHHENR